MPVTVAIIANAVLASCVVVAIVAMHARAILTSGQIHQVRAFRKGRAAAHSPGTAALEPAYPSRYLALA